MSEPVCFEAVIHKLERYTCRDVNIEAKMILKILPDEEIWNALSSLHQPEKTVKVVMTA